MPRIPSMSLPATLRLAAFGLTLVLLTSCSTTSDPSTSPTPTSATITMQRLSDLPHNGGDVSSIAFLDAQTLVAVIDGKIATVPVTGGTPTILHSNAAYVAVIVGGGKEVYALSSDALWVLDDITATPRKSTVYTKNGQTLNVRMSIGPNGQPYIRIYSYPTVMQVFTSTDKGSTWNQVSVPTGAEYGGGLAFGASNEMYASSPSSFYTSTDAGATWKRSPAVVPSYGPEIVKRKNGDVICYVPGGGGLWSSSDNGASFTTITPINTKPFYSTIVESDEGVLYALASESAIPGVATFARCMRSTDGRTWVPVHTVEGSDLALQGATIAIGRTSANGGGVLLSSDKGVSFTSAGMGAVQTITSFGWTADGSLVLLADHGLYLRNGSQWRALGSSTAYEVLSSARNGTLYVAGINVASVSTNAGQSWMDGSMPPCNGGGAGRYAIPAMIATQGNDALVALTYYRTDLQKHTNGILVRLSPTATTSVAVNGTNYVWMAQDAAGTLYTRTENFATNQRSTDNGATWTEVPQPAPGFVFNSTMKFIAYGSGNSFTSGTIGSVGTAALTLSGLTLQGSNIVSALFDSSDRLHILTADQGLYIATSSWR